VTVTRDGSVENSRLAGVAAHSFGVEQTPGSELHSEEVETLIDASQCDFGGRLRPRADEPNGWADLVDLANERLALVYQRLSTHEQVKRHIWSQEAQDALVDLARADGYPDDLIYVERRDLGISGTKGREEREGLAYLIQQVEAGLIEAVYVVHISRLYRDQTLINALALGELFKEHGVIIVTPQMRLNLRDKMHMRLYRMEVERAADELELMAGRLLGARDLKAKAGFYGGESLPPGYILDARKELSDGESNSKHHSYRVYEPHAEVVRTIFEQLTMQGMTPMQVARYCKRCGIAFSRFPPELDIPANRKSFINTKTNENGWVVTVGRVRSIARNPAYIGWRVWGGEVVNRDAFPPIVDEATFWVVQERFDDRRVSRPKQERDPLPLAGLLYCGNHDVSRRMWYTNRSTGNSLYQCCDYVTQAYCVNIASKFLDGPIGEAVISQIAFPGLAEKILNRLTSEYEQAREQAASYHREMKRLESEIENLRGNLAGGILSADQLQWIDQQIQERLARIRELADLESKPIGAAVGRSVPGQADIELVRSFLENLSDNWAHQSNGLKNAFLRLLLDEVVIWHDGLEIRVKLFWKVGLEQELLIHCPLSRRNQRWTDAELEMLQKCYEGATVEELMMLFPGRSQDSIRSRARRMGLARKDKAGKRRRGSAYFYTEEEDQLVRKYYAGEIDLEEVLISTGRTMDSIRQRAKALGLDRRQSQATWEWINSGNIGMGSPSIPTARR
jgi:DNA invertase Pin-like site-specific DNA recombinase